MNRSTTLTREEIRARVEALGEWFHNMDLGGVRTAPNHFLHDYPDNKFRRFAHALPADLSGRSVLDVGCNAGFYTLEMKRRGAARVLGIDSDERYLTQARLAAEVTGLEAEFRRLGGIVHGPRTRQQSVAFERIDFRRDVVQRGLDRLHARRGKVGEIGLGGRAGNVEPRRLAADRLQRVTRIADVPLLFVERRAQRLRTFVRRPDRLAQRIELTHAFVEPRRGRIDRVRQLVAP